MAYNFKRSGGYDFLKDKESTDRFGAVKPAQPAYSQPMQTPQTRGISIPAESISLPEVDAVRPEFRITSSYSRDFESEEPRTSFADFRRLSQQEPVQVGSGGFREMEERIKPNEESMLDLRAKNIREQLDEINQRVGFGTAPEVRNEQARLQAELQDIELQRNPMLAGVAQGLSRVIPTPVDFEDVIGGTREAYGMEESTALAGVRETGAYKAGEIGAQLAGNVVLYSGINKALQGLQAGSKLKSIMDSSKIAKAGVTMGADLLADAVVQTPREVIDAIEEDKTFAEGTKDWLKNRALDMLINSAVYGVGNISDVKAGVNYLKSKMPEAKFNKAVAETAQNTGVPEQEIRGIASGVLPSQEELARRTFGQVGEMVDSTKTVVDVPSIAKATDADVSPGLKPADVSPESVAKTEEETKQLILDRLPKEGKKGVRNRLEALYQEVVSGRVPLESMNEEIRVMSSNFGRVEGTVEHLIFEDMRDMVGNRIGDGLKSVIDRIPEKLWKDFENYSFHKHNINRQAAGKGAWGDRASSEVSAEIVKKLESQHPEFVEWNQGVREYLDNLMKWSVDSGLVSKEQAESLRRLYPNYVPLLRAEDFPKNVRGKVVKSAQGRDLPVIPLDQQLVGMTNNVIRKARKNEMLNALAEAFYRGEDAASARIKSIDTAPPEPAGMLDDIGKAVEEAYVKEGTNFKVPFYQDGVKHYMVVDENMKNAIETFQSDQMVDDILRFVKNHATRPFKALITTKNPFYAFKNILRDIPTALVFSKHPIKMVQSVPDAVKQMTSNGELWKQYKSLGGIREGLIKADKGVDFARVGKTSSKLKDAARKAGEMTETLNSMSEQLPRFAEYLSVLKQTDNPALALYRSAELTTDFSRYGQTGKKLDAVIPYFNAQIQGMDRLVRSLRDEPLKTIASGAVAITVPTMILDYVNRNNEAYRNLSDWERNMYYHIPIPNSDRFIRIPRSRELGVLFGSIFEWAARRQRGEEVTGEEIAKTINNNFSPAGMDSAIWTPIVNAWKQIQDPGAYRTNYFGSLIVPQSMRRYSPEEQYTSRTTDVARAIGQQFEVSPLVVDYLIDSYTGFVGDILREGATPRQRDIPQGVVDVFSKTFTTDPVFKSGTLDEFYRLSDELSKQAQDYNKKFDVPSRDVTPYEEVSNYMSRQARDMNDLRKEQERVALNERLDSKEKKDQIRKLQEEINAISKASVEYAKARKKRLREF